MNTLAAWILGALGIFVLAFERSSSSPPLNKTIQCGQYRRELCETNGTCDVEPGVCKPTEDACYILWKIEEDGVVKEHHDCWIDSGECSHTSECVPKISDKVYFCCCMTDMCNVNVTLVVQPTKQPNTTTVPDEIPSRPQTERTMMMALLPILVLAIIIVVGFYFCRKHAQRQQSYSHGIPVPTHDTLQVNGPPSPSLTPHDPLKPIQLQEVKARGRFGCVWKAKMGSDVVAVKIFPIQDKQSWASEVEIYRLPQFNTHANVLHFIGAEKRGDNLNMDLWLISEFHENGSLYDYLKGNLITWPNVLKIAQSMTRGLSFLHEDMPSNGVCSAKPAIAHRDFKSKNVLVKSDLSACVADFGLAIKFEAGRSVGDTHGQVGTRRYMAPEVLEGAITFSRDAFLRIDMYAVGLVLWELISRCSVIDEPVGEYEMPLEDEVGTHPTLEEMQRAVVTRKVRPAFKETWLKHAGLTSLCETIEECWDHDPEARLSAGCVEERILQLASQPLPPLTPPPSVISAHTVLLPHPYPITAPPGYSDPSTRPPSYSAEV